VDPEGLWERMKRENLEKLSKEFGEYFFQIGREEFLFRRGNVRYWSIAFSGGVLKSWWAERKIYGIAQIIISGVTPLPDWVTYAQKIYGAAKEIYEKEFKYVETVSGQVINYSSALTYFRADPLGRPENYTFTADWVIYWNTCGKAMIVMMVDITSPEFIEEINRSKFSFGLVAKGRTPQRIPELRGAEIVAW